MAVKSSEEHAGDPGAEKGVSEGGAQPRARWANKMEFFLCATTQISPIHSLWNLSFLFQHHGGGAFLIPYCLALFFCGMPLLFLGLALGQYTSQSGVTAWKKICPMFQGVGVASMVILVYLNLSIFLTPGWSLLYLYSSFISPLPWTTCDNWWNTETCTINTNPVSDNSGVVLLDDEWINTTNLYDPSKSAAMEFWRSIYPVESDFGMVATPLHWSLIPCLFIFWILCYFCTWKGIKWTGKVIYTITFAYLLVIILFFCAVSLPGAGVGLKYFFMPDFRSLLSPHTWLYSVTYALHFSSSLGLRTPLGSYNKYNNDCYRDCLILCALHVCTVIFVNCLSFSFVGFVAETEGVNFNEAMNTGLELLFVTFPKALSLVAGSTFWTVLFFLTTLLLTLNQQVVMVECLATNISDLLPRDLRKRLARELLVLAICGLYILLGLFVATKGGLLLLHLVDIFGLSVLSLYFIVCFETIVISWVYGADRFYDNITDMIGYVPFPVPKYCWLFITPLTCLIMLLISLIQFYPISVSVWQNVLGFVLMIMPMMCIPVYMLISLCRSVKNCATPSGDLPQTRPHKPALTLCKCVVRPGRGQPEMSDGGEAIMM